MDSKLRHQLKTDRFAVEVEHSIEYVAGHTKQVVQWAALGVVAIAVAGGVWWWMSSQHSARQLQLARAIEAVEAPVSAQPTPGVLAFKTEDERIAEARKLLQPLASDKSSAVSQAAVQALADLPVR